MLSRIEDVIEDIKNGKMIILLDDENRENEGDLVMAAELTTPETINFMTKYARGLICMPITQELAEQKKLELMTNNNTDAKHTNFTISVDYIHGTTTGISAFDRYKSVNALIDESSVPKDFAKPGHMFPLIARNGGVLVRSGHTEAAVDLSRLAELKPAGVICEIMNDDGTMSRLPELKEFAKKHDIRLATIQDLIEYRRKREKLVECETVAELPTMYGDFKVKYYISKIDDQEHIALVKGDVDTEDPVLVRVHSECLTGDVLHSLRCDCGEQLDYAMQQIEKAGRGVLVYMRQEGRGIGLLHKLQAYALQEQGYDTVDANIKLGFKEDERDYGIGAQILHDLGVRKIRLMSNNPKKYTALAGYGLEIVEKVHIELKPNPNNKEYLRTKKNRMGHDLRYISDRMPVVNKQKPDNE